MSRLRNFWFEADIDGRMGLVTGSPREMDGGISIDLSMRDKGESLKVVKITGWTGDNDETLYLDIKVLKADGSWETISINTKR